MIPYEDLCAALAAYSARAGVAAPRGAQHHDTMHGLEPPTAEVDLPPEPMPSLRSHGNAGGEDDSTHVGDLHGEPMRPLYEDRSNELDIGDVLDEDPKL